MPDPERVTSAREILKVQLLLREKDLRKRVATCLL